MSTKSTVAAGAGVPSTGPAPARIGFVGSGSLGAPTVQRLLDAGVSVRLTVRRADTRRKWISRGAQAVASVAEAASGVDVLVVFVFSDDQVLDVVAAAAATLAAGSLVLLHSTVSISTLTRAATILEERQVLLVDAPVSGTADDIRAGTLTVLLGGTDNAVTRVRPLVALYADPVVHVGATGDATTLKLVNNIAFAAQLQVSAAAVALAGELGIDPARCASALNVCSASGRAMGHLSAFGGDAALFAERAAPYLRKDVAACLASAAELGVLPELLADVARNGPLPLA